MLSRRDLLAGMMGGPAVGGSPQRGEEEVARALRELVEEVRAQRRACATTACEAVTRIRAQQRAFLRAQQRFPDLIEVGIGVWEEVWDWQLRHGRPPEITRLPDGRYGMSFLLTTLVLRPEMAEGHVGVGMDAR
ncbi:MAG TPA: hypothetical protein VNI83_10350 [Vicinamibacterales bacterium]|nr:hypothetical protein [Vicinamibacterales bacterium]